MSHRRLLSQNRFGRKMGRALAVLVLALLAPATASAVGRDCEVRTGCRSEPEHLLVPYGFYNDSTGVAAALAFVGVGYLQPQFDMVVNTYAGSNHSYAVFVLAKDYQMYDQGRWFVDTKLLNGHWGSINSYQNGNASYTGQQAGSNNSSKDNYLETEGYDQYYRIKFHYLLPIGDGAGADRIIHTYYLNNGILSPQSASGAKEWNPFRSGLTNFELEPFYRDQDLTVTHGSTTLPSNDVNPRTSGVTVRLDYDNTDWPKNPSRGSHTKLSYSHDPGWLNDVPRWTQMSFEFAKFVPLTNTANTRQRVLAFDVWTSNIPTWNSTEDIDGQTVYERPPVFMGSTLGGLDRQRGYATNRFNDKAAINYQVEYRHVPTKNPLNRFSLLEPLHIRWIQYVGFVEVGRVADTWNLDTLHSSMKTSVGVGARVLALGLVVRADLAASEEGPQVQMFIGQVF